MLPARPNKRRSAKRSEGRLLLVLGGAASGKSEKALQLAGSRGPRAFVATGQGLDAEMASRIARHQATRPPDWITVEEPTDVETWFVQQGPRYRTILFDCVTLWLSNLAGIGLDDSSMLSRTDALLRAIRAVPARVVVVSNELGCGLVPAEPLSRAFRDLAGRVNQRIAAEADEVHFVVSGIPLRLK